MITKALNITKRALWATVIVSLLVAAAITYLSPETDTYTSNIDDAPMVTRTLVPRETTTTVKPFTTTTARVASAVSAEATLDMVILVDGSRVYYLQRTPAVMLALYMATVGAR